MDANILELKNISISFNEKNLLKDFNLELMTGDKILLSSPSGSGKTTLLRIIMGFTPIQQGEIKLNGYSLCESNIELFRKEIGYLSQKMSFRNLKVSELFKEILNYEQNRNCKENINKIPELLKYLELEEKILDQEVDELSGGEKQRIGFIVAILLDKKIWLFDEITSSLDKELKEKVIQYIYETDKTVILISHDKIETLEKFRKVVL